MERRWVILQSEMSELATFADTLAEDQISLMLQNGRQIRNIIKETYATLGLESDGRSECAQPEPDEVLSCRWLQTSKIHKAVKHPDTANTLRSLTKVG